MPDAGSWGKAGGRKRRGAMQRLPVNTRDLLLALLVGQVAKRLRGPLTVLVIGGNLGLGLALLYKLAGLSTKKEPGMPRLRTVFLRESAPSGAGPAAPRQNGGAPGGPAVGGEG